MQLRALCRARIEEEMRQLIEGPILSKFGSFDDVQFSLTFTTCTCQNCQHRPAQRLQARLMEIRIDPIRTLCGDARIVKRARV
jgi:hypothetical protein